MVREIERALVEHQGTFDLRLSPGSVARLGAYYDLVMESNPLLHLVAPCSPEEFGTRHILESLMLLQHLSQGAKFADVGTGAGLPSIPCLLARADLTAILIESKEKKTVFLEKAVSALGLSDRVTIVNRQYSETDPGDAAFVTSRALDKFTDRLPHLVRWSRSRTILLFAGESMRTRLQDLRLPFIEQLIPLSEKRYMFTVR